MATYLDLKQRIIAEMAKDDLEDDLTALLAIHITDAIDEYASRRFWFNSVIVDTVTVDGSATLAIPATVRAVQRITGPFGNLTPVRMDELPEWGSLGAEGVPTTYTIVNGAIMFDPVPDDAYDLTIYGLLQIDAPINDSDSSVWTNEASRLIACQTRMTLFRDIYRDPEGAAMAANATTAALSALDRETTRRQDTRLVARLVKPNGEPVRSSYAGWHNLA